MSENYPMGGENPPFAEKQKPIEIEVTVSMTLSKTIKVEVDDYIKNKERLDYGPMEESIDFSECNLKRAVEEKVVLPNIACRLISPGDEDWVVDDYEVIKED